MEETITITRKEYDFLRSAIASLQEEIALLKNGKSSKTSHSAPSTDIGRSNSQSLRPVTDRKVGGQLGHAGSTLKMVLRPDKQQHHQVSHCNNCGTDLLGADGIEIEKRQEIVIPPIMAQSVEHITYQKTCPCRLHITQSVFPAHLKSSIQYGSSVASMVAYLSSYQYLPMQRIANLMQCAFGINMSVGTVKNMLSQMAAKALPTYDIIQQTLQASTMVGSDETGSKIAGKKGWFFTWQNTTATFIVASLSRGFATIETYFSEGFSKAVYVSDCLAAQLKVNAKEHQLCLVHLLRELNNFEDALKCTWSATLKGLLQQSIDLKKKLTSADYITKPPPVIALRQSIYQHLQTPPTSQHPKLKAFIERLQKRKNSLLTFLDYQEVPPDNNGSERAIRNIKVKTKVSTQFRTIEGAQEFAILRSVADTAIKNGQSPFEVFNIIANS